MCLIPSILQNVANSSEVNWGPLSDTSYCGRPYAANNRLSFAMIWLLVVVDMGITSSHLECASTMMKYILT